jgi:hypothetical protein
MFKLANKNNIIIRRCNKIVVFLSCIVLICSCIFADEVDSLIKGIIQPTDEEKVSNLIETILDASPQARAKADSYAAKTSNLANSNKSYQGNSKKQTPSNSNGQKTDSPPASIPVLEIASQDLLEVTSKFPKNYIGMYVYGPVTFRGLYDTEDGVMIGFDAKNWRGFWLYTNDSKIISKFTNFRWGMKFSIPKNFPLKIVEKKGPNYILRLPFES